MLLLPRCALAALLAVLAAACSPEEQVDVKYAPDMPHEAAAVSFLGVYRDGLMDLESWDELGPPIAAALGQRACDAGYSDDLKTADSELYAAIEEEARAN